MKSYKMPCPRCKGDGRWWDSEDAPPRQHKPCPTCGGEGIVNASSCAGCGARMYAWGGRHEPGCAVLATIFAQPGVNSATVGYEAVGEQDS